MPLRLIVAAILVMLWTAAASATNNLQFGPPPDWVNSVALPPARPATQAAVKFLLDNQQIKLTPNTVTTYAEYAVQIQTPQGLSAAGTVAVLWNPDTDTVTVNKVEIHRGDKVINVLSSGQTFTIARREVNLDYATLDDTLTAVLEPADLQIGDTLEVAYTLERTDPVLAGTPEAELIIPTIVPVSKVYVSAIWPSAVPIKWQATKNLTGIQLKRNNKTSRITLAMNDVQPILQPKGAPTRFLITRRIDFTGFTSWAQLAQRFAPLYQSAAILPPNSPLQAEIARINAATPDPKRRAAMALALVQDKVRYVLLAMNQGGLVPSSADLTWSRRFGDCKAKTVLLLTLLHGLGIEAQPVVVNVLDGGGLDIRLPMIQLFNHVLVRAVIEGNTYWLDETRFGDTQLDRLHEPFYHWGLPLVSNGAQLVRMLPPPRSRPQVETLYSIDATGGVTQPAPLHAQADFHGEAGILLKIRMENVTPAQRDQALRNYWSSLGTGAKIKSVSADYDESEAVERLTVDGTLTMDWSGGEHDLSLLSLGYDADFKRERGPNQDAPYAVTYPYSTSSKELIKLPLDGEGFSIIGSDVKQTLAGIEYQRHVAIDGGVLTGTVNVRSIAPEFPANLASAYQKALHKLANTDIEVQAPIGHAPTDIEIAWGVPKSNSNAADYVDSGNKLLDHRLYADARADYNAALALNARDAWALADRGLTYAWLGDQARAAKDFTAALAIDSQNWVAFNGRGLQAYSRGDDASGISAFTQAIRFNPKDDFALYYRAVEYWRTGKDKLALADLDAAVRLNANYRGAYWVRALIFIQEGKTSEAMHQAQLIIAAAPKQPAAYYAAAAIYNQLGKHALAVEALNHTLPPTPTLESYLARAAVRPWKDLEDRRTDIESALKLDPKSATALVMLAQVQMSAGHFDEAAALLTAAISKSPNTTGLLILRAIDYEKSGETTLAAKDLAKAQSDAKSSEALNNVCWGLATAGVSLVSALDDCNAALAKSPRDANGLDSRGFVLMKLGRYGDAISAYDDALKVNPWMASALYGRGICELRSGKSKAGQADIRTAMTMSYVVADEFSHYGVNP